MQDPGWMTEGIDNLKHTVLNDLLTAKQILVSCFPKIYSIGDRFTHWYHMAVCNYVRTLISYNLDSVETAFILTFDTEYRSSALMGHPSLNIDCSKLPPLIDSHLRDDIMGSFMASTRDKLRKFLANVLEQEKQTWHSDETPEMDGDGGYCTFLPQNIKKIFVDQLNMTDEVDPSLKPKVFDEIIYEIEHFTDELRNGVLELAEEHSKDRQFPSHYLPYLIAVANNCYVLCELVSQLKKDNGFSSTDTGNPFGEDGSENLIFGAGSIIALGLLAEDVIDHLLIEVFMDLTGFFEKIMTENEWLNTDQDYGPMDTIVATIEDYANDFSFLLPKLNATLFKHCERKVSIEYIQAIFARRMKVTSPNQLNDIRDRIVREADSMKRLIDVLLTGPGQENTTNWVHTPLDAVKNCAEILVSSKDIKSC